MSLPRNRLAKIRQERQFTLNAVAKGTNQSTTTISRHERGERGLRPEIIKRYAQFYGISAFELFIDPTEPRAA